MPSDESYVWIRVNRTGDTSTFPKLEGNIAFSEIRKDEQMESRSRCEPNPEAYVIDTDAQWKSIAEKIHSESLPNINFGSNTVLAYFWGRKPNSGNSYSISKVEANSTDLQY